MQCNFDSKACKLDAGPCLNIKTVFPMYGDSYVKDKTVDETVLSLTWESLYWQDGIFILRRPPVRSRACNSVLRSMPNPLVLERRNSNIKTKREIILLGLMRWSVREWNEIYVIITNSFTINTPIGKAYTITLNSFIWISHERTLCIYIVYIRNVGYYINRIVCITLVELFFHLL